MALAEWGARLVQKGFVLEESQDGHPFARYRVIDSEGAEAGNEVREKLWEQTGKHLIGLPGGTREIEDRLYLNWEDYLKWRGRRVKGDLQVGLRQGLVVAQWNRWTESVGHEEVAALFGVNVDTLDCHADGYTYQVSPDVDELSKALRRREKLLASQSGGKGGSNGDSRIRIKAQIWVEMAEEYLGELYTLQATFDSINQRYFDGQAGLFPGSAHALSQLVEQAEKLVNVYNRDLAADLELMDRAVDNSDDQGSETRFTIGLSDLRGRTPGAATDQAAYLVDMAKAEALDAMGEDRKAVEFIDKYV